MQNFHIYKEGKTNLRYLLVIAILAVIVGGGVLAYQYWWLPKQEIEAPEVKPPEVPKEVVAPELNLKTTKLATIPGEYKNVYIIVFSPNGKRVAYVAEKESKHFVVINNKDSKAYDEIKGFPIFSPNSQRLAYVAKTKEGKVFAVVDEKEGSPYDWIEDPVFSPDSKQLAYIVKVKKEKEWLVVVNGKEGKAYDDIYNLTFSPDSQQLGYTARKDGREFIVINEKEGKTYDYVGAITFSSDGKQIAYQANEEGKGFIVINGKEGKAYDYKGRFGRPIFSSDNKHVIYGAKDEDGDFVVIDGKESARWGVILGWSISYNGKRVAYSALKGNDLFMIIDGIRKGPYSPGPHLTFAVSPIFSPDGEHVAYPVIELTPEGSLMGSRFIVDDKEGKIYRAVSPDSFIFSPNSKHYAYLDAAQMKEKESVVIDDKERGTYDRIYTKPVFSPDSKYVAFGARGGNELWWIVEPVE